MPKSLFIPLFRVTKAIPEGKGAQTSLESKRGGITLYRFDSDDRVILEIGEESGPGPAARVPAAV